MKTQKKKTIKPKRGKFENIEGENLKVWLKLRQKNIYIMKTQKEKKSIKLKRGTFENIEVKKFRKYKI